MMSQGSHISERYYKSRIPKVSHTLGCNHIRVNPTGRCTTTQLPGLARTAKGSDATVAMSAASQAPHVPRAMRIAERDAEYRQHQSPNGGRQTAQPASSGWLPLAVGTNQRPCERPTQLQRVNITSMQRTTLGLPPRPSGAAVNASLAPAQPPPPAGLASSPACTNWGARKENCPGRWKFGYIFCFKTKTLLCISADTYAGRRRTQTRSQRRIMRRQRVGNDHSTNANVQEADG